MTDWRQIRARIRRAKAGPDAVARLEQLFDKTRDGMVAFELAQLEELSGRIERATDWYKRAWQRFRRSEWKQKAEEALTRHGIPIPPSVEEEPPELAEPSQPSATVLEFPSKRKAEKQQKEEKEQEEEEKEQAAAPEPATPPEAAAESEAATPSEQEHEHEPAAETAAEAETAAKPRRRRRRGGRGRGRGKTSRETAAEPAGKTESEPEPAVPVPTPPRRVKEKERRPAAERPTRGRLPAVQIYRRGEPALASEIKALEAKLRQLLASQPHSLGEESELPANPGVYLISDLDLTTMYYLEACGNMRSAMDQLVSGRRGRQGSVRSKLAKYLGISDSQASRYVKQHCVARWIDLEESDAGALRHFARAVLRPELMEETD